MFRSHCSDVTERIAVTQINNNCYGKGDIFQYVQERIYYSGSLVIILFVCSFVTLSIFVLNLLYSSISPDPRVTRET